MDIEESRFPGFREFAVARSPALYRTAYLLCADPHAAQDLLQETLARVAGRWCKIVAGGDPEPYVRRVLYTVHVSRWRRTRRLTVTESAAAAVGDPSESITHRVVLQSALARLSRKQRAVLVLRFYEDLTIASTAQVLGVPVSTVKSQAAYALARLRELAGDDIAVLLDSAPRPIANEEITT